MRRTLLILAAGSFLAGEALAQRGGGGGRGGPPGGGGGRGGPPPGLGRGGPPAGGVYRGGNPGNFGRVGPVLPATSYNIGGSPRPGMAFPGGFGRPLPGNFGSGGFGRPGFNGSGFALGLGVGSVLGSGFLGSGFGGGWGRYSSFGTGGFGGYGFGRGYDLGTVYQPTYVLSSPAVLTQPAVGYGTYSYPTVDATTDDTAQADALVRAGRYAEAVAAYQQAAVNRPQDARLPLRAARALTAAGQYDQAAGAAQQGLAMLPPEQWLEAVRASALELPSAAEATAVLSRLRTAADAQGAGPGTRFLAGLLAAGRGDNAQAVADLDAAAAAAPQDQVSKTLAELVK